MIKVKEKKYFAKGKRSVVYLGKLNNKKIVIKKATRLKERVKNEVYWLRILNKYNIGPKLIFSKDNYIIMEFVEGERIIDWINKNDKKKIKKVLRDILNECRTLDKLKVNKEEMHNPYKHILIRKKVRMIDFERCHKTNKPKNVTQFCQFLMSEKVYSLLKKKGFEIDKKELIRNLKKYKGSYNLRDFDNITELL